MEAKATARTVLVVPRKTRLVTRLIQGKSVEDATNMLSNMNKKSARLVNKVLLSATANAENNLKLDRNNLYVKSAYVNDGPILKRHRFGSRSHIDRHDKKTSHITVIVAERAVKAKATKIVKETKKEEKVEKKVVKKETTKKVATKKATKTKKEN
ncbi:MAG: 50S ribosomal protein L22 [Bacilli bacterium]|nr:50S ribosomal protein L22 [Bacilli bacterium]